MKIASWDKRVIAYLIDEAVPFASGALLFMFMMLDGFWPYSWFLRLVCSISVAYLIYIIVNTLTLFLANGFTVGTVIVGIRIESRDGEKLKFRQCLLRALLVGVVAFALINAVYMLVIHTERSAFDRLSDTTVNEYRHRND